MKKVLVDMHRLGKNSFNGLYIYSKELGDELIKLKPDNVSLYYYLPKNLFGFFGKAVQYIKQSSFDKFFHRKGRSMDIWHSTTSVSWYMPANKRTKFIFTLHDINFLLERPEDTKRNAELLKLIQERIDRADHVIAISQFALQQARENINMGNKPVTVIYNGCIYNTHTVAEEVPKYVPTKRFLFSVGLVQKRKNFHTVIPLLLNNDLQYIIAGIDEFDYKQTILETAAKYNVQDRVIFTGPVSEQEKVWYYKNCEAFMFPSFAEGFGLPVIEAMYFGKPVFTSDKTSLPEVGGDAAYYFTSFEAEAMIDVFNKGMDNYRNTQPQEKIRQQAAKFSFKDAADAVYKIYESL
jgi:glycosyltransferase involved in cell wall biosynthesis